MSHALRKLLLPTLFLLVASCSQKSAPPPSVSTPYTSADGKLSMDFPAAFTVETQTSTTPVGEIVIEMATCEFNDSSLSSASTLYPFEADEFDPDESLAGAVEGVIRSCNGSLLRSNPVEVQGMSGQEGVIHVRDDIYYRYRIVVNGTTPSLYIVQVVGRKNWVESEAMTAFVESMKLDPQTEPNASK